jgi:hypothetical protein
MLNRRVAVLAVAAMAGCGGDDEQPPERAVTDASPVAHTAVVDERRGTWRGIGIGSKRREVESVLGRVRDRGEDPLAPLNLEAGEAGVPPAPDIPRGKTPESIWRARDAALIAHRNRAWLLVVTADGAVTRKGVGVGDTLDEVHNAYPQLRCDVANKNTEYDETEFCAGRIARKRYVWFGDDPVGSITVSEGRLR